MVAAACLLVGCVADHNTFGWIADPNEPGKNDECAGDATALCRDGWCSFSRECSGTCSSHGGVKTWLPGAPAECRPIPQTATTTVSTGTTTTTTRPSNCLPCESSILVAGPCPPGYRFRCEDGMCSLACNSQGACSSHGGIAERLPCSLKAKGEDATSGSVLSTGPAAGRVFLTSTHGATQFEVSEDRLALEGATTEPLASISYGTSAGATGYLSSTGAFTTSVPLAPGENRIAIVGRDFRGEPTVLLLEVSRVLPPFEREFEGKRRR
ncbi:MAG: DUF3761 domain-containing protein [Candidatus Wallbacteria bacterium]|nr:DUF3761 domain-containing protein [Candidatus Wallbacteria bacterium]